MYAVGVRHLQVETYAASDGLTASQGTREFPSSWTEIKINAFAGQSGIRPLAPSAEANLILLIYLRWLPPFGASSEPLWGPFPSRMTLV